MGHVPRARILSISELRELCYSNPQEGASRLTPWHRRPSAEGGTDSKHCPPQTGVPTALLALQVPTQYCADHCVRAAWGIICPNDQPSQAGILSHIQHYCNAHSKEEDPPTTVEGGEVPHLIAIPVLQDGTMRMCLAAAATPQTRIGMHTVAKLSEITTCHASMTLYAFR